MRRDLEEQGDQRVEVDRGRRGVQGLLGERNSGVHHAKGPAMGEQLRRGKSIMEGKKLSKRVEEEKKQQEPKGNRVEETNWSGERHKGSVEHFYDYWTKK